jgi:hypothetical protein
LLQSRVLPDRFFRERLAAAIAHVVGLVAEP